MPKSTSARVFIALIVISGLCVFGDAVLNANSVYAVRFVSFVLVACVAARLRLKLPGSTGNMSVNLPFILVAVAEMSSLEALIVGCVSTVVQTLPRKKPSKVNSVQAAFNFGNMALAVAATRLVFQSGMLAAGIASVPIRLCVAALVFFLINSVPVAVVIALSEAKSVVRTWIAMAQMSFAYFVASAGIAATVLTLTIRIGWEVPIAVMPLMLGIYLSYKRLLGIGAGTNQPAATAMAAKA